MLCVEMAPIRAEANIPLPLQLPSFHGRYVTQFKKTLGVYSTADYASSTHNY